MVVVRVVGVELRGSGGGGESGDGGGGETHLVPHGLLHLLLEHPRLPLVEVVQGCGHVPGGGGDVVVVM